MFPELNCRHETENDVRIVHDEMLQTSKIKTTVGLYVDRSQPAQKPLLFVQIL